jgi:hypothetical protein
MSTSPVTDVCVAIPDNCPMKYLITAKGDEIEFSFGGRYDGFHHIFGVKALRQFLQLAEQALSELPPTGSAERRVEVWCSPQSTPG